MNGNLLISATVCILSSATTDSRGALLSCSSCSTGRLCLACCTILPRLFEDCCLGASSLTCNCFWYPV